MRLASLIGQLIILTNTLRQNHITEIFVICSLFFVLFFELTECTPVSCATSWTGRCNDSPEKMSKYNAVPLVRYRKFSNRVDENNFDATLIETSFQSLLNKINNLEIFVYVFFF